jgi:hypothetical protein
MPVENVKRGELADDLEFLSTGTFSIEAFRAKYERYCKESALLEAIWESLEHYLSDGDIRQRDAGYRRMQEAELKTLIRLLRSAASNTELARISFLEPS